MKEISKKLRECCVMVSSKAIMSNIEYVLCFYVIPFQIGTYSVSGTVVKNKSFHSHGHITQRLRFDKDSSFSPLSQFCREAASDNYKLLLRKQSIEIQIIAYDHFIPIV